MADALIFPEKSSRVDGRAERRVGWRAEPWNVSHGKAEGSPGEREPGLLCSLQASVAPSTARKLLDAKENLSEILKMAVAEMTVFALELTVSLIS